MRLSRLRGLYIVRADRLHIQEVSKDCEEIMRHASACAECRRRKRKCVSSSLSSSGCDYCAQNGKPCSLESFQTASPTPYTFMYASPTQESQHTAAKHSDGTSLISDGARKSPSREDPLVERSKMPSNDLQQELVALYFDYIHDQFHSIFHPPTMMEHVKQGIAPRILVLGMMALSARFSQNKLFSGIPAKERGISYARDAEKLLNLHDISVTTIQSVLLLGAFWTGEGDPAFESVFVSIAIQMASLIDLTSLTTSSSIEKETHIRIWWTLRMIDVWTSNGVGLPRRISRMKSVPLPGDDLEFIKSDSQRVNFASEFSVKPSPLISEMVKLNCILAEIYELHEDTIEGRMGGTILETRVKSLGLKLDEWYASLPEHMRDKPENLALFASVGLGRVFVAVYCGYYHYGQLLYYQFLHCKNDDQFFSTASAYAVRCNAYSAGLCEIIYAAHSTPGCDVLYNMIGHVLVIASTVQIHTLLNSSSEEEIATTKHRLERNFEIMLRLHNLWPALDMCLLRLRIFHAACRRSLTETFLMDRWMLRFLRESGREVDERSHVGSEDFQFSLAGIGLASESRIT